MGGWDFLGISHDLWISDGMGMGFPRDFLMGFVGVLKPPFPGKLGMGMGLRI